MKHSSLVFRVQLAMFKREKGMLVFYLLCIAVMGIIIPIIFHSMESIMPLIVFMTMMFLKPLLSDSLAGERERKTLESLLSTSIHGKHIIWGKSRFCISFAAAFFTLTVACAVVTYRITGYTPDMTFWQWVCVIFFPLLTFIVISIAGSYASAKSADSLTANSKVSRIAYPFGLLMIIYITVVFTADPIPTLVTSAILTLVYLCVLLAYTAKISKMKQADYFENIKIKKSRRTHDNYVTYSVPKSQLGIVFLHELKYLLTLKTLFLSPFGIWNFCFVPAIFVYLFTFYTGKIDLTYAVLATAFMIPRIPLNLISYSIGGEKVYKTGESLLSTPLHVRPLFIAKCMIPILVSSIMLILSSLLTLAAANLINIFFPGEISVYIYNTEQIILLFPVSIMSCVTMVFITGVLSVNMKTPRQGLYASSLVSFVFVIPPLIIVYLTQNILLWSCMYFTVLLLGNALCVKNISDKITRPYIMSKL